MRCYGECFSRISKTSSIIICNESESTLTNDSIGIRCVKECDYTEFYDSGMFCRQRDTLVKKIENIIDGAKKPAAIVCHNLNLGKNPALSSAVSEIARRLASETVRFFWVIHDFAEEGRLTQLDNIRRVKAFSDSIWDDLYAKGAFVQYVVPGKKAFTLLEKAKFPVFELPNPVECDMPVNAERFQNGIDLRIEDIVRREGGEWYPAKRTGYYSSRMIYRKNYLEAILFVCILLEENLVTGLPGNSCGDIERLKRYRDFVSNYKLPVFFDASRLCSDDKKSPVSLLYTFADYGVSTSVAEGFGYSLFEPWLYGRSLIGRVPDSFMYPEGVDSRSMYSRLPIPAQWVDTAGVIRNYCKTIARYTGKNISDKDAAETLLAEGTIDFGIIPEQEQYAVLFRLLENKDSKDSLIRLLDEPTVGWPGMDIITKIDDTVINQNRICLRNMLSVKKFEKQFKRCFMENIPKPAEINISELAAELLGSGIRLLLLPSES
ncbi:MAG: glycosyltransferase family 4 protein [Fibrobacter sp.]|nr:glycosyltransferase family 4 protein [Fibrobacter sp.]